MRTRYVFFSNEDEGKQGTTRSTLAPRFPNLEYAVTAADGGGFIVVRGRNFVGAETGLTGGGFDRKRNSVLDGFAFIFENEI